MLSMKRAAWLVLQALGPVGVLAGTAPARGLFALIGMFCSALLVWVTIAPLRYGE